MLHDLAFYYPGMNWRKNSHLLNMRLLQHGICRGKAPDLMEEARADAEALAEELALEQMGVNHVGW